jgi:excisionase family DNA binding protein
MDRRRTPRSELGPVWLSTVEAGRRLGVSDDLIRARVQSGQLRAVALRSGGRVLYRIHPDDLEVFRRANFGDPRDPPFGG